GAGAPPARDGVDGWRLRRFLEPPLFIPEAPESLIPEVPEGLAIRLRFRAPLPPDVSDFADRKPEIERMPDADRIFATPDALLNLLPLNALCIPPALKARTLPPL